MEEDWQRDIVVGRQSKVTYIDVEVINKQRLVDTYAERDEYTERDNHTNRQIAWDAIKEMRQS